MTTIVEQVVALAGTAVTGGGIGAVATVLVARARGRARERDASARERVAQIESDTTLAGRIFDRMKQLDARVDAQNAELADLRGKVDECEDERDRDRDEHRRDRDECAKRDRELRQTIADLQAHIERSFVPVDRFERRVARVVAKTQSQPELLAHRGDDSQEFLVENGRGEDTRRTKPLRPPPLHPDPKGGRRG